MKSYQKGICPPPPMKQIFLSSVLVGLLSVSAEATAVIESDNQIQFTTSGDTFTPSGGVYEVSSGKKTITIDLVNDKTTDIGAIIDGGVKVTNGILDFQFKGGGDKQSLAFGSDVDTPDSRLMKTEANGKISFNFSSGIDDYMQSYALIGESSSIENFGTMEFVFGKFTSLDFKCGDIVNKNGGIMSLKFLMGSEIFGSENMSLITESGAKTTISFLENSFFGFIIWNEISIKSDGETTLELVNSKVFMGAPQLEGVADKKEGISITLREKSSIALGSGNMQNVALIFEDDGNTIFSHGFLENITWLDNKANSNSVKLSDPSFSFSLDYLVYRNDFRMLEIGNKGDKAGVSGISGNNLTFVVYANLDAKAHLYEPDKDGKSEHPAYENNMPVIDNSKTPTIGGQDLGDTYAYSDRVIIHSSQNNQGGVHNIGVVFSYWDYANLSSLSYKGGDVKTKGNIAIASVAKSSNVELNPTSVTIGFNSVETSFEKVFTDDQGIIQGGDQNNPLNTYTTYFLKSAQDVGVAPITQEVTSSVFALNYDLFIANFNSLNKRMGDLRNNPYSQGAWGRIFNGQLSNDFGLGSQNNYTTLQAGYDYDFSLSNAKNYLGVAFAYGFSISEMSSNASNALQSREIKDIFSNNIEFALYNAYVEDSGLYSDSIAKFSYLMSDFNLTNNGVSEKLGVNNYAFQLSEEVGYVFSLGGNKEWSITPQAELSFGYYSDSDLAQVAGEFYLDAKAKSMMMLRTRVGTTVGYDFKQFTQGKGLNASLYAGLSYEYDYLNGGDIELTPNVGKATTTKSALSSDGRGVLNLGTNITFKDDIRLYADFQTSFGGKINTDYQINIGARFSFGEKGEGQKIKEETPLKIEG